MIGVPTAGLLAALGIGEKVRHACFILDPCGDSTWEDAKLISPKPVHTQMPWSPGTGDIQLGGFLAWGGSVPESCLPCGHAEADRAHGALGDLPP